MNIAMLFSNVLPPQEGEGNYVYNLSRKLIEKGNQVSVITRGSKFRRFDLDGIEVFTIPFIKAYPFHVDIHGIFVKTFLRKYSKDVDVIHMHSPLPPAINPHNPAVVTFHTPLIADAKALNLFDSHSFLPKIFNLFASRIERSLIKNSDVITAVSNGVVNSLKRFYSIEKEIFVLGNAVNDEILISSNIRSDSRDPYRILYVSRLDPRKGLFDLIDSMKIIIEHEPRARLEIIGKGPLRNALINRISKLGLGTCIQIRGYVTREELFAAYKNSSIPSYCYFEIGLIVKGLPTILFIF